MRRVDLPSICCKALFFKCANRIGNKANRIALTSRKDDVANLSDEYVTAAK